MREIEAPSLLSNRTELRKLSKLQALASFSPDALASIGYADQEIYLGLVVAGSVGLSLAFPIALTIIALLAPSTFLLSNHPKLPFWWWLIHSSEDDTRRYSRLSGCLRPVCQLLVECCREPHYGS